MDGVGAPLVCACVFTAKVIYAMIYFPSACANERVARIVAFYDCFSVLLVFARFYCTFSLSLSLALVFEQTSHYTCNYTKRRGVRLGAGVCVCLRTAVARIFE